MALRKILLLTLVVGAAGCTVDGTTARKPGQAYAINSQKTSLYGSPRLPRTYEYPDLTSSEGEADTTQTPDTVGTGFDITL
jgi:hypothetical protein